MATPRVTGMDIGLDIDATWRQVDSGKSWPTPTDAECELVSPKPKGRKEFPSGKANTSGSVCVWGGGGYTATD